MTNPYLRAAQRHAHIRQQALERLNQRPARYEWIAEDERPATPPSSPATIDVAVIKRARDERGQFIPDDPSTPDINEAWQIVPELGKPPSALPRSNR
jgi:hypothetical protein